MTLPSQAIPACLDLTKSLVLALSLGFAPIAAADHRPNVLLIAIDDLNDWVHCLGGHPMAKTPNLDRLAARGTLFTNAHCQAPLCNSSRTSLITSLRPTTTGIYGLAPWFRNVPYLENVPSLPQPFREAGYRTAITGKIYHTFPKDRKEFELYGTPPDFGPFPENKFVETPVPHKLVDWGVFPTKDEQQGDWPVATWAAEFIAEQPKDEPFLLACGFCRPHVPCYASQKWFDLYPETDAILPPYLANDRNDVSDFSWRLYWKLPEPRLSWLRQADQWHNLVRSYLASVSFVDSQVGRVLDALDASGNADNTIVVLLSDHGWHLGEKDITGKNTVWERSTHVPLMISGPTVPRGQRCSQPVELLDVFPTLLDLAGLAPIASLEGLSLGPQIDKPTTARRPALTTHNPGNHGVRDERWRYIRYADGSEELYDLKSDPNEWRNLIGEEASQPHVKRLAAFLPSSEKPLAPGSAARILENKGGEWFWEGKRIIPSELER